jgi:predicted  nucleic acid-binding Zn-ribbon protein
MKTFPYKTLFLCIFLPPIFYILTLNGLERYVQKKATAEVRALMIRDPDALYQGRYTVKEEVSRNMADYLSRDFKYRLGVRTSILVKTKDDRILFPSESTVQTGGPVDFTAQEMDSLRYMEVASENYRILSEGLALSVGVQVRHNTWLSNAILVFYVFIALLLIQRFVRKGLRESEREGEEQKQAIQSLTAELGRAESKLAGLETQEAEYLERINALKKDRSDLARDIDELLEEIEKQETGLSEQARLKEEMAGQVLQLRTELDRLALKSKKKKKTLESAAKRFTVLYKNLAFTERALEGFLDLTDEFQLKAEEVIHKLNEEESAVSVKRKVFGKGGKMNVLEVAFSYSGRIYYQKDSQAKKTVVAVGTKNTQEKDLAYLESIAS